MKAHRIYVSVFCLLCLCIFSVMLFFNFRTTLLADDYAYRFNFSVGDDIAANSDLHPSPDSTAIQSLRDIVDSMASHRISMNGRVIPHGIVQFFLWVSPALFKPINSAVFLLEILLILYSVRFVMKSERTEYLFQILLLCGIFSALYLFTPAFGQVNLWLDGSVNYLWCSMLSILYMDIVLQRFAFAMSPAKAGIVPSFIFVLFSFTVGSWAENSGGALIIFMLCIIASKLLLREKIPPLLMIGTASVAAGFAFLISAPAELKNKIGDEFSLMKVFSGAFQVIGFMQSLFWPLCIATAVLLVLCFLLCKEKKQIIHACILIVTALAAAFCLAIGRYIPERSFFFTVAVLIMANTMMCAMLIDKKRELIFCAIAVLLLFMPKELYYGALDIHSTYSRAKANEICIEENVRNGVCEIRVPVVSGETKYSALYDMKYLDRFDAATWPNCYMAKYFGADRICGFPEDPAP